MWSPPGYSVHPPCCCFSALRRAVTTWWHYPPGEALPEEKHTPVSASEDARVSQKDKRGALWQVSGRPVCPFCCRPNSCLLCTKITTTANSQMYKANMITGVFTFRGQKSKDQVNDNPECDTLVTSGAHPKLWNLHYFKQQRIRLLTGMSWCVEVHLIKNIKDSCQGRKV